MNININANLVETLARLATARSTTPELYVENFINNHLISQRKNYLIEVISTQKSEDIPEFEVAVKTVTDTLKEKQIITPEIITPIEGEII